MSFWTTRLGILGRLSHDAGWLHPNKTEKRRTRPKEPKNKELKKRNENQRKNQTGKRGRGIEKQQQTKKNIKSMMFFADQRGLQKLRTEDNEIQEIILLKIPKAQ